MKKNQPSVAPEESRDSLLQAAIEVFAEVGYDAASVRTICGRAGLTVAMVRYHFGDKRGLYDEVVRFVADADARAQLLKQARRETGTPEDALRLSIRSVFRRLIEQSSASNIHLRLMLNELVKPSSVLTDEVKANFKPLYDRFRRLVGSILGLPVNHAKTRLATHSILAQMVHYVQARPILGFVWPEMVLSPGQMEMVADHIADFSLFALKGIRPHASKTSANKPVKD